MATETSTLLSTQNADNVAITGGNIAGTTISGATILASVQTLPAGYGGTFVAAPAGLTTVSSAAILITSAIIFSPNIVAVRTTTAQPYISTITAGQFIATAAASDSSTYNWAIIKTA